MVAVIAKNDSSRQNILKIMINCWLVFALMKRENLVCCSLYGTFFIGNRNMQNFL